MIDLRELPDDTAELLHEELEREFEELKAKRAGEKAQVLKETSLEDELGEIRAKVFVQERRLSAMEELLRDEQRKNGRAAPVNGWLRTLGIAALLSPAFYGLGRLAVWLAGFLIDGLSGTAGTLVACLFCVTLGLLLLLLSKGGGSSPAGRLENWLRADDWPEGPEEEVIGLSERRR